MFAAITEFAGNRGFKTEENEETFNKVLTGAKTADVLTGIALLILAALTVLGIGPNMGTVPTLFVGIGAGFMMGGSSLEAINWVIDEAIKGCKDKCASKDETSLNPFSESNVVLENVKV